MDDPLVSVIIPTYNRGRQVLDAVACVRQQTYGNVETVVVVDGSTDGTLQMLHEYRETLSADERDRLQIVAQANQGVSCARNNGVRNARGSIIAFRDDDDPWHPDKLAQQVAELQSHPADQLVLCTTDYITADPKTGAKEIISHENPVPYERVLIIFPPPSAWLMRRETFEAVGGFDVTMKRHEDGDFLIRLRKKGALLVNVTEPLTTYTLPTQGKIYGPNDHRDAAIILERHGHWYRHALPPEISERMLAWLQRLMPDDLYKAGITKLAAAAEPDSGWGEPLPSPRTFTTDLNVMGSAGPAVRGKDYR